MMGKTHMTGGSLFGLIWISVTQPAFPMMAAIIGSTTIGSLLPDCDHGQSKIAHANPIFGIICSFIQGIFGHRGFTHSLIACPLFGILGVVLARGFGELLDMLLGAIGLSLGIAWGQYSITIGIGFMIGALSHLFYDIFNKEGCPLLFPSKKRISILPITTGSMLETVFLGVSITANALMMYVLYANGTFAI